MLLIVLHIDVSFKVLYSLTKKIVIIRKDEKKCQKMIKIILKFVILY